MSKKNYKLKNFFFFNLLYEDTYFNNKKDSSGLVHFWDTLYISYSFNLFLKPPLSSICLLSTAAQKYRKIISKVPAKTKYIFFFKGKIEKVCHRHCRKKKSGDKIKTEQSYFI